MKRILLITIAVAIVAVAVAALDAQQPRLPQAIGRVRLLVTVEIAADGTARVIESKPIRNVADATKLVEELAVQAAGPNTAGQPGQPGQCEGITTLGARCKNRAAPGSRFCHMHDR